MTAERTSTKPLDPALTAPTLDRVDTQVTLTANAAARIRGFNADRLPYLRFGVEGGGCGGFQYLFALEEAAEPGDHRFESEDITLLVDALSYPHVSGATIDFTEGLNGSGFQVENPHAQASCGCGQSFQTDKEGCGDPDATAENTYL